MRNTKSDTFNLPSKPWVATRTPAAALRYNAVEQINQAKASNDAADLLERLGTPTTPEGWYMYVTSYGSSVSIEYTVSTEATDWHTIAQNIAMMRNAYHIPSLERKVVGGGEYIANEYRGSVKLASEYWPHETLTTLNLRINTGSALPPSCTIVETRTKVRKTVEVIERKVVCA